MPVPDASQTGVVFSIVAADARQFLSDVERTVASLTPWQSFVLRVWPELDGRISWQTGISQPAIVPARDVN